MAAPKGNKYGKGHGRPPVEGYTNEVIEDLGKELLEWLKNKRDLGEEVIHLSEWYSEVKEINRSRWRVIRQRESFQPYYERAMDWLGVRIMKNPHLDKVYGSRFLGIYLQDVREHEREISREKIDYELTRKMEIEKSRMEHPNDDKLDELIRAVKESK